MRINENKITGEVQGLIALHIAGKLFEKVRREANVETADDLCACVAAWELKEPYRYLNSREIKHLLEGKLQDLMFDMYFGYRFTVNADVTKLARNDSFPEEPNYSIIVSISTGGEKVW